LSGIFVTFQPKFGVEGRQRFAVLPDHLEVDHVTRAAFSCVRQAGSGVDSLLPLPPATTALIRAAPCELAR
jgi:hypothetical protein